MKNSIELGCGLIGIGRKWGAVETDIPSGKEVLNFLDAALLLGIVFFDTAPAYGDSELRLGKWLKKLNSKKRDSLTVATKFGEHWVDGENNTIVDHGFEALKKSLDQSVDRLGKVDILQLHKADEKSLLSNDVDKVFNYAKSLGISKLGASVSSMEAGKIAVEDGKYSYIQFPFNRNNKVLIELVHLCLQNNIIPIINRPVNMGKMLEKNKEMNLIAAYSYIFNKLSHGIILTGTKNIDHLKENADVFNGLR